VNPSVRGAALIALSVLAGCASPMGQREAQSRAGRSLREFCASTPCGSPRFLRAQKIKDRWLVDFETASGLYTVAVDRGGNTAVSVWDRGVAH